MTGINMERICANCGKLFTLRNIHQVRTKYCSLECRTEKIRIQRLRHYHGSKEVTCSTCKFLKECQAKIWDVAFTPYCFPGSAEDPNWRHAQFRREGKMEAAK